MTAAERQRHRRARLAAERPPKRDIRAEKLSRLFAEVERLRAELGMPPQPDPRDGEIARLQAEVARLQSEVERLARAAEKAPGDDEGYRAVVRRLQREIERLKAERRTPFADAAILSALEQVSKLADNKGIEPQDAGQAAVLKNSIDLAIRDELERRRKAFNRIEKSIAKLAAIVPDAATIRRRNLMRMINHLATPEGERANARAALARMK